MEIGILNIINVLKLITALMIIDDMKKVKYVISIMISIIMIMKIKLVFIFVQKKINLFIKMNLMF